MDDESRRQAADWAAGSSIQALEWTWRGFDALRANVLSRVDMTQPLEQLERDLTSFHFQAIQQLWARETEGYSSISPVPEWPEMETRSPAPAKPPAYDIAFVWNENKRVAWPIEAKVVPTTSTLAPYLGDTAKFVNGTAAPLVGEGAQVAYLLSGTTSDFFSNLSGKLASPLQPVAKFSNRPHRLSQHTRATAPNLRLHHLAMHCGPTREVLPDSKYDE
jgi:hypothetical protein